MSKIKNGDMPANPVRGNNGLLWDSKDATHLKEDRCAGLTKREYFAGLAMQGFISSAKGFTLDQLRMEHIIKGVAKASAQYAEALLEELDNEN